MVKLRNTESIELFEDCLLIQELRLANPEVLDYFNQVPEALREEEIVKAIEIGISVMSRLQQSKNLDFIEARLGDILL